MAESLTFTRSQWRGMLKHIAAELPREACGFFAGYGNRVDRVIPITNTAQSRTRFKMDPSEQIQALMEFESAGYDLLGIYHSHPLGPDQLSRRDLEEITYPEAVYLLFYRWPGGEWDARVFQAVDGGITQPFEVTIEHS